MGKAADIKFGRYINRVHPNKSPLKFFNYPLLSQERTAFLYNDSKKDRAPVVSQVWRAVELTKT